MSNQSKHIHLQRPVQSGSGTEKSGAPRRSDQRLVWNKERMAWVKPIAPAPIDRPPEQYGPVPTVVEVNRTKCGGWWIVKFRYHAAFIWHLKREINGGRNPEFRMRKWDPITKSWMIKKEATRTLFLLLKTHFTDIIMSGRARGAKRLAKGTITTEGTERRLDASAKAKAKAASPQGRVALARVGATRRIRTGEEKEVTPKEKDDRIPDEVYDNIKYV